LSEPDCCKRIRKDRWAYAVLGNTHTQNTSKRAKWRRNSKGAHSVLFTNRRTNLICVRIRATYLVLEARMARVQALDGLVCEARFREVAVHQMALGQPLMRLKQTVVRRMLSQR
jgi:hypothetical protein